MTLTFRQSRICGIALLAACATLGIWFAAAPLMAQATSGVDADITQAAYSTPVNELPEQMPVIPVCPPTEPYVLPGDPNAPVTIDNQLTVPIPLRPAQGSLTDFLRQNVLPPVEGDVDYIPRFERSGVGFVEAQSSATIPVFRPNDQWSLLLTPYGRLRLVDGPVTPDLPPRLLDSNLIVSVIGELQDDLLIDAAAIPGYHTDGVNLTSAGFRVPFYTFVAYRFTPTFLAGVGVANLQMRNTDWIPIAGLIWMPDDNTRIDLIPPKPRIAHRFQVAPTFERWWYFAAEFGGGQWAIRRADGTDDVLTYRDYRVLNGVEQRSLVGGIGGFFEYGYVFARKFEYGEGTPSYFEPGNTALVRLGLEF